MAVRVPGREVLEGGSALAEGGRARNVVPDHFVLNVNHRFTPDQSTDEAKRDLLALVGDRAEVEWRDVAPAAWPSAEHPLIAALAQAGVEAVEPKQAWTDVASFARAGVATANFGPGLTAQAHQRNEHTSLTKLEQGRTILCRWLEAISAGRR